MQNLSPFLCRPADVALAFVTLLDDDESNGDIIKVTRNREEEKPPVLQQILSMDKSRVPVISLLEKKTITTPSSLA